VVRSGLLVLVASCGFSTGGQPIDAPPVPADESSADAFDASVCGATYPLVLGRSRYRIEAAFLPAWVASDTCAAELPGATHLVVFDTIAERDFIQVSINGAPPGTNNFWVGGVQRFEATQIGGDWLALTGGPMVGNAWNVSEPTDDDGAPPYDTEVHAEQFVRLDRNSVGLLDAPGKALFHGFVCECDGLRIDPAAAAAILASKGI
jgi:hypothetical protein